MDSLKEILREQKEIKVIENTYAGWRASSPGEAICKMIEFHEGKNAAKGSWERLAEIDEIISEAINLEVKQRENDKFQHYGE